MSETPLQEMGIPAPPGIEDATQVELVENEVWNPEVEGEWLQGFLTDIREVPIEDRVNLIYDFSDVSTAIEREYGEAEDAFTSGPDHRVDALALWGSAMLDRRLTPEVVGKMVTVVYDGRGRRKARIYRVFVH